MKVTIVGKEDWKTKDRATGQEISGLAYIAFTPQGQAIKFTSLEDYPVHVGMVGYDETLAIDVNIKVKLFGGKVTYQDLASFGKPKEETAAPF